MPKWRDDPANVRPMLVTALNTLAPRLQGRVLLDGDRVPFTRVFDVARWMKDVLDRLRIPAVANTSGASGMHICITLPKKTTYLTGQLLCHLTGVSTPLTWNAVAEGVDPRDFTVRSAPARFREVGGLWAPIRTGKTVNIAKVLRAQ